MLNGSMSSHLFPFFRFHVLRLVRAQPGGFAAVLVSALLFVLAAIFCITLWQKAGSAEAALQATLLAVQSGAVSSGSPERSVVAAAALPAFNGAEFVAALNLVAAEVKLPVDEVLFTLDEGVNQPYLRYRITLSVVASYPVIRRFVDQYRRELEHVTLDSIACTRETIGAGALTCDLAFFAFYRKP